ncbi:MBOAT family O-acyltransferase [Geomesophilobacter sediminis]|uniref:MBOAT family protein n=1 Tax=Geomesophilobacter sediminis TaxID=2798584 RepID=A0A8J7JA81_9BACT|nr:MBOAT family protein [Geomesophilobacter sediminis]MBJ6723173.1 MBOAT family protein [Geomesophilobacter sediminis]
MIFTSYTYLLFLSMVFLLYWSMPPRWRNVLLIAASYFFYSTWDWRFGFLLLGISVFNWAYGRFLATRQEANTPLVLGVLVNLVPLLYFKYTGFFLTNLAALVTAAGGGWHLDIPKIILPLGISFFTFQGVAYLVDVWVGEEPFQRLRDFLLFKAFWPQLIAGPIIRPHEIADQILATRHVTQADLAFGCQRILFGFFKKVVIADALSTYIDAVFLRGATPNGVDAIFATFGFGLQIYFDFSAYSDIAIGSARLFGFTFPENFNWPYAAPSPQEFWTRWHMTLSRWIRDYVFTPISFSTRNYPRLALLWLLVAMAICGLWHGAQWTFVAWGCWHGSLLVLNQTALKGIFTLNRKKLSKGAYFIRYLIGWGVTYLMVNLAWVLFRAQDMTSALSMYRAIFTLKGGLHPAVMRENTMVFIGVVALALLALQVARPWLEVNLGQQRPHPLHISGRALVYTAMIVAVIVFDTSSKAFVYFQF